MLTRILLTALLASALAFAQGGRGGSRGGVDMPNLSRSTAPLDRLGDALKLTKDQKKDIKAAMDDAQKEAAPVHDQVVKSHQAIAETIAAGKTKEEVDKAVAAYAEVETQLTSIELHAFAKAAAVLEPDQKRVGIYTLFNMVHGAFNGKNWNQIQ